MVNYSRFIGEAMVLMYKPSVIDFPLRQIAGKGPKMGSHEYRRLRRWKRCFVAPLDGFRVYEYI